MRTRLFGSLCRWRKQRPGTGLLGTEGSSLGESSVHPPGAGGPDRSWQGPAPPPALSRRTTIIANHRGISLGQDAGWRSAVEGQEGSRIP